MPRSLEIRVEEQPGVVVICPDGRIDSGQVQYLDEALTERVNAGDQNLIVDFQATLFLASSVLRVLLVCRKSIAPMGGRLVVCNLKPHIVDLFRVAGFDKLLTVCDTRENALLLVLPDGTGAAAGRVPVRTKPGRVSVGRTRSSRTARRLEVPLPQSLGRRLWSGLTASWRLVVGFVGLVRGVDAKP